MDAVVVLLLLIVAAVLFTLGMFSVPLRWFNPVAAGLLTLTIALWLGPALGAL